MAGRHSRGLLLLQVLLLLASHTVQATTADHQATAEGGSCEHVAALPPGEACAWAEQHCETDALVPYARLYYCHVAGLSWPLRAAALLLLLAELVLLFRVLGSTAEDFLSPPLTQLSQEMGLPPRFAGVTFLALGNGAPDLSASIAAIKAGNYDMALGAQIGSGCFVGCVVAGCVLLQGDGVRARGALVRDVAAYFVAVVVVASVMATGTFAAWSVVLLLVLYCTYVAAVLAADVWHRAPKRWRSADAELRQSLLPDDFSSAEPHERPPLVDMPPSRSASSGSLAGRSGAQEDDVGEDGLLSGTNGRKGFSRQQIMGMSSSEYTLRAWASIAHSGSFMRLSRLLRGGSGDAGRGDGHASQEQQPAPPSANRSAGWQPLSPRASHELAIDEEPGIELQMSQVPDLQQQQGQQPCTPGSSPRQQQRQQQQRACSDPEAAGQDCLPPQPHYSAASASVREQLLRRRWVRVFMTAAGAAAVPVVAAFDTAEWPLTIARRAVVPLVAPESYNRQWFLAAMALSPLFASLYLRQLSLAWLLGAAGVGMVLCGLAWVGVHGRDEPPFWGLGTSFPIGAACIAVCGFLVAAMWVDVLATELVGVLACLGALLRVDHTVLGLTVLAWGNSMGDLSSNMAMVRRGLSNMAITACFAGPLLNVLVGMGAGFAAYFNRMGVWRASVRLPAAVMPGAALVLLNCGCMLAAGRLHGNHVPSWYGWVCIALYGLYMAATVVMSVLLR